MICAHTRSGKEEFLAFSKRLPAVDIRIYYKARNSIKEQGEKKKQKKTKSAKKKSSRPSASRKERKRKELYLSCRSNSSKSPKAVNRRAMDFPRGHVNLLDFTTDLAATQRYIYSVTSLRMD